MEVEALDLPPREAVRNFRAKGLHAGFSWLDTDAASHLKSFTVAKAMQLDVLQDIRSAVDRAIAEGITFEEFQEQLEPVLVKKGWWGRQKVLDPETGEFVTAQLGSPRRLQIIFDTNLRMSYARGRWERIERVAEARPWLRYVATLDNRTRPEHRAWHGTVLPWNDPFWRTHFPPNGWRCRCGVQQLSAEDLEEFHYKPSNGAPTGWNKTRAWTNRRTGKATRVPKGIDPGFSHNVGMIDPAKDDADRLIARIDDAMDPALRRAAIGRPWNTDLFQRHLSGASDGDWPIAVTDGAVADKLAARSSVVRLSGDTAVKQVARRQNQGFRPEHYATVQRAIDEGEWFDGGQATATVGFVQSGGRWWKATLKRTKDGSAVYLQSLHRIKARKVRAARKNLGAYIRD